MSQEPKLRPEIWKNLGTPGKGAAIGLDAMLPFLPGMLGSRRGGELRDVYSGVDPVPVRAGRWWEVGSTAFEGTRIKEWRPPLEHSPQKPRRGHRPLWIRKRSGNTIRSCIQSVT